MSITILTAHAALANYCDGNEIPASFEPYTNAFNACRREWRDLDGDDDVIAFWAGIVCGWADAQGDSRQVHVLTDSFGTAGGDDFDCLADLYRTVCQLAADNGGRWFEDDGLVEGRDYEFVTMLMNPATGSVAPKEEWEQDFREMTAEEWGGDTFEGAGLIEVVPDGTGGWKEA